MRTILLCGAAALALAGPAQANAGPCTTVKQMAISLMTRYREVPLGSIPGPFPSTITLYASDTGTWTVVQVLGDRACIVEGGKDWTVPTAIHGDGA